jgi:HSP20 family protein
MSLVKWNQPSKLLGRRNWIENFFAEADDFLKNWDWDRESTVPAVNVREEKDAFMIDVAAPGMKKDDFKVEFEKGVLMISGKTETRKEEKTDTFQRKEFSYADFKRSFWVPENVNADQISAVYEDGLLKLKLPKLTTMPEDKGKTIKVV